MDFFDVKGVVEELALWAGLTLSYQPLVDDAMHPGQSAAVLLDDRRIGRVGRLHPMAEKALDTDQLYIFELDGSAILQRPRRGHGRVSRYQPSGVTSQWWLTVRSEFKRKDGCSDWRYGQYLHKHHVI